MARKFAAELVGTLLLVYFAVGVATLAVVAVAAHALLEHPVKATPLPPPDADR
ncbi:hypothetical protein AB0L25_13125 [Spirillospora sp. NPDC052242]